MRRRRDNVNDDNDEEDKQRIQTPEFPKSSSEDSEQFSFSRSQKRVFAFCLAFRMLNSLLVQSYFNPDEHWQGPEVAHRIAFGYLSIITLPFHSAESHQIVLSLHRFHVSADLAGTVT